MEKSMQIRIWSEIVGVQQECRLQRHFGLRVKILMSCAACGNEYQTNQVKRPDKEVNIFWDAGEPGKKGNITWQTAEG